MATSQGQGDQKKSHQDDRDDLRHSWSHSEINTKINGRKSPKTKSLGAREGEDKGGFLSVSASVPNPWQSPAAQPRPNVLLPIPFFDFVSILFAIIILLFLAMADGALKRAAGTGRTAPGLPLNAPAPLLLQPSMSVRSLSFALFSLFLI